MFNNSGNQLKKIAPIILCFLVAFSLLVGAVPFVIGVLLVEFGFIGEDSLVILLFFGASSFISLMGVLISWVISLFVYAFGDLVENNQAQVYQNDEIIRLMRLNISETNCSKTENDGNTKDCLNNEPIFNNIYSDIQN